MADLSSIIQDPRYVTNWADPLRKHVADEHRKNREHLAEQLAHSAQVEKADTGVLALNITKKGAQFSHTLKKRWDQYKKSQDTKFAQKWVNSTQAGDDLETTRLLGLAWNDEAKKVMIKDKNFLSALEEARGNLSEHAYLTLKEGSAGEIIKLQKHLSVSMATHAPILWNQLVQDESRGELNKEYDRLIQTGDTAGIAKLYKQTIFNEFKGLNLSDGLIAATAVETINKQATTKSILGGIDNFVTRNTDAELRFDQEIISNNKLSAEEAAFGIQNKIEIDRNAYIAAGMSKEDATAKAKEDMAFRLIRLIKTDQMVDSEWQKILTGKVSGGFGKDKPGEILFTKELQNRVGAAMQEQRVKKFNANVAVQEIQHNAIVEKASNIDNFKSHEERDAFLNDALLIAQQSPYSKPEQITTLERLVKNSADYTTEFEKGNFQRHINNGTIIGEKQNIKEDVTNNRLVKQLNEEVKIQEDGRSDNGIQTYSKDPDYIKGLMEATNIDKALFKPNVNLSGTPGQVNNFIVQKYRKDLAAFLKLDENKGKTNLKDLFDTTVFEPWLEKNDFYKPKGTGILASGNKGTYPNYKDFVTTKIELKEENQQVLNDTTIANYDQELSTNIAKIKDTPGQGTTLDRLLDMPEGTISVRDLAGVLLEGQYSQEILFKAKRLGITPDKLVERARIALLNAKDLDDETQSLVDQLDLNNVTFPNHTELLDNLLNDPVNGDPDLRYLVITQGPENLTDNQNKRLVLFAEKNTEVQQTLSGITVEIEGGGSRTYYPGSSQYQELLEKSKDKDSGVIVDTLEPDPSLPDSQANIKALDDEEEKLLLEALATKE